MIELFEPDPTEFSLGFENDGECIGGRIADEARGEERGGLFEKFPGRADLLDASAMDERHAIAQGEGFGLVVRDEDEGGRRSPSEALQIRSNTRAKGGVEIG